MENRRMSDPDKIELMIEAEGDPKERAFLLILNNINKSLVANTETIKDVAAKLDAHITKFESHTTAEERLINQGRGAWKVVAWVIGIVQVVGLAIWVESRQEIEMLQVQMHQDQVQHARIMERLSGLERSQ